MKPLTKDELDNLIMDAYALGANDSQDVYMYVSKLVPISFQEVDAATTNLFGNFNMNKTVPINIRVN
jgi:hypothetical protein